MTTLDKIDKAEERIKELKVLILHWRKTIDNINHRDLELVEQIGFIKDERQAA